MSANNTYNGHARQKLVKPSREIPLRQELKFIISSKQKRGIRLMFWSGADFNEEKLNVHGEKFKDASIFFQAATEIEPDDLKRWLIKSRKIQWDYKNIVKRKGKLIKL